MLELADAGDHLVGKAEGGVVPILAWTKGVEFQPSAKAQVARLSQMPFVFKHVAVMPDVHFGIGATVGSVIATKGAIIPASVGVDIGCGMVASQTNLRHDELPSNLGPMRSAIEDAIPHGGPAPRGDWGDVPSFVDALFADRLHQKLLSICQKNQQIGGGDLKRVRQQLGTLGTGNHFVEVCTDEMGMVWVMLHSGSRGIGNRIGQHYIAKAKQTAAKYFYEQFLPEKDLAYLPAGTPDFDDYLEAVHWAQQYAFLSRQIMLSRAIGAIRLVTGLDFDVIGEAVNCHHNYVSREKHFGENVIVTRKGAVSAKAGELGIIPGSMGAKSFIVEGLGNRESFHSCSHGAGRRLGRNEAKKRFTVDDLKAQTVGVECRKDADVIDEIPQAYKDIDAVVNAQKSIISVKYTLKQILCVKG